MGHPLQSFLTETGETLAAFAERIGTTRQTLYRAMRGQTSLALVRKIVAASDGRLTADDFLTVAEAAE